LRRSNFWQKSSDLNKPNGQYVITPADVPEFLRTLPLGKIPGVGKVSAAKLEAMGCEPARMFRNTTGHVAQTFW
jgi:nucleotidyltransferase/DNA polymerase involved in DNA repair